MFKSRCHAECIFSRLHIVLNGIIKGAAFKIPLLDGSLSPCWRYHSNYRWWCIFRRLSLLIWDLIALIHPKAELHRPAVTRFEGVPPKVHGLIWIGTIVARKFPGIIGVCCREIDRWGAAPNHVNSTAKRHCPKQQIPNPTAPFKPIHCHAPPPNGLGKGNLTTCERKDIYRIGRCNVHGGLSTGPRSKSGKAICTANAGNCPMRG